MRYVAGSVWRSDGTFEDGWLAYESGRILDAGPGQPPEPPVAAGVVVPQPVNAHTHVGDAVARGLDLKGKTLEDLVAPPSGLKHQVLANSTDEEITDGIRVVLEEMIANGTRCFLDFREGGKAGVRQLRAAARGLDVNPVVLARPRRFDDWTEEEVDEILDEADGIAVSALADVELETAQALAARARKKGKRFALHFSEGKRESVHEALDLDPWFLVHCVYANDDDLHAIAKRQVPVVVCPRSNAFFGALPDVESMVEAGIPLALGTDNAMLQNADVFEEMRLLRGAFPDLSPETLLEIGLDGGHRLLHDDPLSLAPGAPAELSVLAPQGEDPRMAVFGEAPPRVLHVAGAD